MKDQDKQRDMYQFCLNMKERYHVRYDDLFWRFFEMVIPRDPKTIAEYGVGPGLFLRDAIERYSLKEAWAFDYSEVMLEHASQHLQGANAKIHFEKIDLQNEVPTSVPPESIDIIFTGFLFRALNKPLQLLENWKSALSPHGTIVIYDFDKFELRLFEKEWAQKTEASFEEILDRYRNFSKYSIDDLRLLFEKTGFREIASVNRSLTVLFAATHA